MTESLMPDLILMDIQMQGIGGLEATRQIKLRFPYVKIVIITVSDDASHLFEALKQGAQGYLLKNLSPSTWIEYLHAIMSDEAPLSRELATQILREFPLAAKSPEHHETLTNREREILNWVASGLTNKEIAAELHISDQTVKNHDDSLHLIVEDTNRRKIGYVIIQGMKNPNRCYEIVRINLSVRNQGYGKKVMKWILDYLFNQLKAHRVWLDVKEGNQRAFHVYQSLGFKVEGTLRECIKKESHYESLIIMGLLRTEYS